MSGVLERLYATIEARAGADPATSHTAALLAKGPGKCAEKFGEEAVEAIVAAAQRRPGGADGRGGRRALSPAGHARLAGVPWADVLAELERREGVSGVAEKASRPR